MKKNISKKPAMKNYNNAYLELPEIINMDALCFFDDDTLDRIHNSLQSERERASRHTEDLLPWEVEICYVQREMKIRSTRRAAHEKYVRNNPDAAYYEAFAQDDYEQSLT